MQTRHYGSSGPVVILIHGGPGASGYMAPVARELADSFQVMEPLQRVSGGEPLTVSRHIADLHELIESNCEDTRPTLVGHSWGAMLALGYAAAHPGRVASIVLVGCGTFDAATREQLKIARDVRTDDSLRQRLERLRKETPDPDKRLEAMCNLTLSLYSYDLITTHLEVEVYDSRAHRESWEDMVRLQDNGMYPAALSAIDVPVLMLHGTMDPHPGRMIRASLEEYLPQIEYREWDRCGHDDEAQHIDDGHIEAAPGA